MRSASHETHGLRSVQQHDAVNGVNPPFGSTLCGSQGVVGLVVLLLLLGGCAASPPTSTSLPPVDRQSTTRPGDDVQVKPLSRPGAIQPDREPSAPAAVASPAVIALLDQAGAQAQEGQLDRAAATLERALRIEPGNAGVWHDLGEIRYHQGQYRQAVDLAARSRHLAAGDPALQASTWRLTAKAKRAVGDRSAADFAVSQAVALERSQ